MGIVWYCSATEIAQVGLKQPFCFWLWPNRLSWWVCREREN